MNSVNFRDIFIGLARRLPKRLAVQSPNLSLTYEELIARAARSAHELRERGVVPGVNVGIATRDSAEGLVLMLAVWMLGAIAVPVDFKTRPAERASFVHAFDFFAILEDHRHPGDQPYRSIIVDQTWSQVISAHPNEPLWHYWQPAPAYIGLTSGTTGQPVGIVVDHERLLARVMFPLELARKDSGGRLFNPIQLSFGLSVHNTLGHMLNGGTVIFSPPVFGMEELANAIIASESTSLCAVPTIVRGLLDLYGDRSQPVFGNLNLLYCTGAPMSPEEKKRAKTTLTRNFAELYASTFAGRISLLDGSDIDEHADTVGRVLPQVSLQIVDQDDNPLPVGEPGNIRVRSPGMARTIYRAVERSSGDRINQGWVYTGDIGVVGEDGFLRLLGRDSDVLIRGGENIHPAVIEAALLEFPGVREAVVVGFSATREGEEIAAFIIADGSVTEPQLIAHCRSRLAPNKHPRRILFVADFPRNENGKIVRSILRNQLEQQG